MRLLILLTTFVAVLALACRRGDGGTGASTTASEQPPAPTSAEPSPTEEASAGEGFQRPVVEALIQRSELVQVACLDANTDGLVDANDADPKALADITGDDRVDDADLEVIRRTSLVLPAGKPGACFERDPAPDWQISAPADVDCEAGKGSLIVLSVGGGGPASLGDPGFAAGMRWMLANVGEKLGDEGVPHQLASVAPGLNGTGQPQLDAEAWATAYLTAGLERTPCLRVAMLGHSHGGMLVKAVASRLEQAGLGDRVLLTVLIDPIAGFYHGTPEVIPQTSPVLNIYQMNDTFFPHWPPIDQPNVENWDVSGEVAPEHGDAGGAKQVPVVHTNVDNSRAVQERITERIVQRSCKEGLC